MSKKTWAPTTIYLKSELTRAMKVKAALKDQSLSDLVNDAVALYLSEDEADLRAFKERRDEPEKSFEDVLTHLKKSGLI